MDFEYKTRGTCSSRIRFSIENGALHNVSFTDGCPGNTLGIAQLVEGMKAEDVARRLKGVRCGRKATSCPDQLATAVEQAMAKLQAEAGASPQGGANR